MEKQRLLRVWLFAKRKNMTEDEFQEYWTQKHGPLVKDWLARHGILQYTQFHTPPKAQTDAEGKWPALKDVQRLGFDGAAEFVMPDISCFVKAREDPYYASHVQPDEEKLFDQFTWTVGWVEIIIKDGKVLEPSEEEIGRPLLSR